MNSKIYVKGARENNLKNIDVEIPRDALTVVTGLSGSGKSSLAFDTIYAEGQRRYVESLSSYARMFLGQKDKPDVDYIDGLSPAISIDQKTTSQNPRSTVGTVTEIYDYLRLLWARVGTPHCPNCGKEIRQQSIDQIIEALMALPEGTRIQVMAPVIRGRKGEYAKVFEDARRSGYVRVRVDGSLYELDEEIKLNKNKKHNIEIVVDRLILRPDVIHRLTDSAETAASLSGGLVLVNLVQEQRDILFSQNYACEDCGVSIEELTPRMFSFNNPFGACPACTGLGSQLKVDPELVIPNKTLSILDGAICASGWNNVRGDGISRMYFDALSKKYHFSLREPVEKLSPEVMDVILYGTKGEKLELHYDQPRGKGVLYQPFEGIVNNLERRYQETQSESVRAELEECMSECPCPVCQGRRLRRESLAVTVGGMDIDTFTRMSVTEEIAFVDSLTLTEQQLRIGERILKEIKNRLGFLQSVGLDYLTLSRASATLSGGESQRIRLATQIGSSLMGVLYILDEPSIGLHQRDNDKLLATLKRLRDLGNTLIVVEHDEDTMRAADYIVDIGPGAGVHGGRVVAAGTPAEVMANEASLTGQYLSGIVFCLPALVLGQILPSFLQIKNCQRQLVIAAFAQIAADVILDYLNVTLFHGGMFGMAMATVISVYLYILLMLVPCFTRAGYRFSLRFFSFAELAQICGFGLLYLVYKACVAFMNLFLNRLLSARGGVHYVTANSIIFSVELLIGAFPSGFGSTTHMLIGMEKEQHGSLAAAGLCQRIIRLSVIVNLIQIIVVMLGARPIVSLFSPESEATAALSVWGLRLYVLSVLPNTINYIIRNYEQDINHQGAAYLICLLNHIILPVAVGLALTVLAPIRHIWLCFVIGQGICLFISFAIMHKDMTRLRKESI